MALYSRTKAKTKRDRWGVEYPEVGRGPVSIEPYISQEHFEFERDAVFRKCWLHVGRVEEIPNPGDYFTKEIVIGRTCLLIVRGEDGEVRAFHNMCSHRGNRLAYDASGNAKTFVCEFHGWTFGREGELLGVPGADRFENLDFDSLALTPVASGIWNGFIFVNLDPQPRWSLKEYLGDLWDGIDGYPFDYLSKTSFIWRAEMDCNWKLVRDAFNEAYHAPFVHARSVGNIAQMKDNPVGAPLAINLFDMHHCLSVWASHDFEHTPIMKVAERHAGTMTRYVRATKGAEWQPKWPGVAKVGKELNPSRSTDWVFDIDHVFPNLNMHLHDTSTYLTWQFWPVTADKCVFEARWYFPEAKTPGERFSQECAKVLAVDTAKEDLSTCERVQSMLNSGAKTEMHLADQEVCIRHGNNVIDKLIDDYKISSAAQAAE